VSGGGDLNKVIVQVTQNLSLRVSNTHGFDVPCIWVPQHTQQQQMQHTHHHAPNGGDGDGDGGSGGGGAGAGAPVNALDRLVGDIGRAVLLKAQANMAAATADCAAVEAHVGGVLDAEGGVRAARAAWWRYAALLQPLLLALAVALAADVLLAAGDAAGGGLPGGLAGWPALDGALRRAAPGVRVLRAGLAACGAPRLRHRLGVALVVGACVAGGARLVAARLRRLPARGRAEVTALRAHSRAAAAGRARVAAMYLGYVRGAQAPECGDADDDGSGGGGTTLKQRPPRGEG
jgi:hypothetical protein